jgi:hypothetical protein
MTSEESEEVAVLLRAWRDSDWNFAEAWLKWEVSH